MTTKQILSCQDNRCSPKIKKHNIIKAWLDDYSFNILLQTFFIVNSILTLHYKVTSLNDFFFSAFWFSILREDILAIFHSFPVADVISEIFFLNIEYLQLLLYHRVAHAIFIIQLFQIVFCCYQLLNPLLRMTTNSLLDIT